MKLLNSSLQSRIASKGVKIKGKATVFKNENGSTLVNMDNAWEIWAQERKSTKRCPSQGEQLEIISFL